MRKTVLIAGIGGASLGTELLKCLRHSGNYDVFGADVSPYAYGLYEEGFVRTHVVDVINYIPSLLNICVKENIDAIIPGGEEPLRLLCNEKNLFDQSGILLAINSLEVIQLCSDKIKTFDFLTRQGILVPATRLVDCVEDLDRFEYPCIIKPSMGSGGSVFVFLAEDEEEAMLCVSYLEKRGMKAVAQEYIPHHEGEYTVGVLSLPTGELIGSIALRRFFTSKLSYLIKYGDRIISSGYSQGLMDSFDDVRRQAEEIALKIENRGPLNIQGRIKNGVFEPFELNPRFSASTYLRTMAGFNEVDMFLEFLFNGKCRPLGNIKYGYYLRSLEENYVGREEIRD